MRKIFLALMLSSLVLCQSFAATMSDRIEMGVSPIKHEMIVNPGQTIAKTITFYNNADIPYNLYLSSEDCRADTDYGTPKCSQKPNVDGDPIYASTWITFSGPTSFTVPPNSEYTVNFTIQAPTNAVPGGHYGAIFFNNPTVNPTDNSVTMLKRIGTLLLLTVPGDIVYNTVYGSISIGGGGGRTSGASPSINPSINSITAPRTPREWMDYASDLLDPSFSAPTLPPARPFDEAFRIPVSNSGNVHILPVGRIELYDERGLLLENIGKESVRTSE